MRTQFNPIAALLLEIEFYIPLSLCWSRNHPGDRRRRSHHPANNHHHHRRRHRPTDPTHHPHPHHNPHRRCPCRLCFFVPVLHPLMRWMRLRCRQPLYWPRQSPEYPDGPRRFLARPVRTRHGVAWPLFGLCLLRIWWPFPFLSDCCHLFRMKKNSNFHLWKFSSFWFFEFSGAKKEGINLI